MKFLVMNIYNPIEPCFNERRGSRPQIILICLNDRLALYGMNMAEKLIQHYGQGCSAHRTSPLCSQQTQRLAGREGSAGIFGWELELMCLKHWLFWTHFPCLLPCFYSGEVATTLCLHQAGRQCSWYPSVPWLPSAVRRSCQREQRGWAEAYRLKEAF